MTVIDLTAGLEPSRYGEPDTWSTRDGWVLDIVTRPGRLPGRFAFGFVGPDGSCRREYQGPVLPGPYAYGFGLAVAITADPEMSTGAERRRNRAAGTEIDAKIGDEVVFRGFRFRIESAPNDNVKLTLVGEQPKPALGITDQAITDAAAKCGDGEAALVTVFQGDGLSYSIASEDTAHRVARALTATDEPDGDGDVLLEVAVVHADRTWALY